MRIAIAVAILLILAGGGCLLYSNSFPVYPDQKTRWELANELENLPRETRFVEWYSRLRALETPHKRFSDLGRGLSAAGAGLLGATAFWVLYHRHRLMRQVRTIFVLWWGLWLVRIPLTVWYYILRQKRGDYPWWGDSIGIGIFGEWIAWLIGAVVSSIVLRLMLARHPLPDAIQLTRPVSRYGWVRAIFIGAWLLFLANGVFWGVPGGDEGAVFTGIMASVILLAFLSATEVRTVSEGAGDKVNSEAQPG
jgi:hypothetical protein